MDNYLTYEQFGAVGDGHADDMPAIARTHEEAARLGLPVKAKAGAHYYISPKAATAVIFTSTDWSGARFTIDDRGCEDLASVVFSVPTTETVVPLAVTSLARGQSTLGNPCGRDAYVTIQNENHRDYIRLGLNQNNGQPRQDYLLLHADGSLSSPVSFDFDEVTLAEAHPIEETMLTLTGGEFTTIANPRDCTLTPYTATCRNIHISRSNVEVAGLTHLVTGEGETGTAYSGFLRISDCARIRVHDCLFTGHYIYWCTGSADKPVAMGSYDLLCDRSVDVRFENCSQTTDITDGHYWGLFASNFCRELQLENCTFSRFDAHMGVSNCVLRGCTFGHQCVNIIGNGSFLMENVHVYGGNFARLRDDYGSTFRGELVIRNCTWHPSYETREILYAFNAGFHDFGYTCYLPQQVLIDGFTIEENPSAAEESPAAETPLAVFMDFVHTDAFWLLPPDNPRYDWPIVPPARVTVRNLHSHRRVVLCSNPDLLKETVFTVE